MHSNCHYHHNYHCFHFYHHHHRKATSSVTIEELDDLTNGLQRVSIKKQRSEKQDRRLTLIQNAAMSMTNSGCSTNLQFWNHLDFITGGEHVLPSLYAYIEFRLGIDPEYDAMGWADMAEFLFEDYKEDELLGNVKIFMDNYSVETNWTSMVDEVQAWHAEYFRRLKDPANKGGKCLQGVALQNALLDCIKSLLP